MNARLSPTKAFTIIELLVAVAILAVLVILIAQLVQSGSSVISRSRGHLSADAQAREVFSRLGRDLAGMPVTIDLGPVVSAKNDKMFFYSESPGFSSLSADQASTLSLVGYRVNTNAQMERLGSGLGWASTNSPVFVSYSTNMLAKNSVPISGSSLAGAWGSVLGSGSDYEGTSSDYHLIADGVFRLAFTFRKSDGSYVLPYTYLNSTSIDVSKGALSEVTSVIVTLAVLDSDSRKIASDLSGLSAALPDPTQARLDSGELPAETWQKLIQNASSFANSAGIPVAAASKIKIYQRSFPLKLQ